MDRDYENNYYDGNEMYYDDNPSMGYDYYGWRPCPYRPAGPWMGRPCRSPWAGMGPYMENMGMYDGMYDYTGEVLGAEYYDDDYLLECEHYESYLDELNEMYPDLSPEAKSLLRRLMAIDFAIIDLHLYLDTHPDDERALAQHNRYAAMREPIIRRLNELYGPLMPQEVIDYPWAWLNQPWPWRIEF